MVPSILIFEDSKDHPSVQMDLPSLLPIGERIRLRLKLRRRVGPRTEEFLADGEFRVTEAILDASITPSKQVLKVTSTQVSPSWRAVRNKTPVSHPLAPTHTRFKVE